MQTHPKIITALATGAILLPIFHGQTASATLLDESGASTLADAFGIPTGPETLTVNWSVVENAADIYTYSYTVQNPSGDDILNDNGTPTATAEIVDAFSV